MLNKTIKVNSSIEAKDVALIVQKSSLFNSNISIKISNKTANAKSIMGLIALGDFSNEDITLIAEGSDEEKAMTELVKFFS